MNYLITASTDIGIRKNTNQDSLSIKIINTIQGKMVFAVLCDGLGGLKKGEAASASVVNAFNHWVVSDLPSLCNTSIEDAVIKAQWERIIAGMNEKIINYGKRIGVHLGTTVVAMLLTRERYYIINVGDSRAYELTNNIKQLTKDQTLIAREVEQGYMTWEKAKDDPRRSVLLQCVGASSEVHPEMTFGATQNNAAYFLCSDGFVHHIGGDEIYDGLRPETLLSQDVMKQKLDKLIDINKQRNEQDNISVALIRTY